MTRVEHIGAATLYLGDCRELLPTLQRADAIVTDPPYGQSLKVNVTGKSVSGRKPGSGRPRAVPQKNGTTLIQSCRVWPAIHGDDAPFEPEFVLAAADKWLIWGAHKFGHRLPPGRTLVWDKVPTGKVRDQGDGEVARCSVNPDGPLRIYRLLWDGVCVGAAARHEVTAGQQREHPTQKPEALIAWCLQFLDLQANSNICDPFMGAGSTGMAAVKEGHRFIGIEIDPLHFQTACRRIEDAQRQGSLFGNAT